MAREKGTFNFSANLEVKKQGPLDARQSLITYAELTQATTWQDESGKMYLFDGLTVPVTNGSEKQYYMLINAAQYNQTASWKRIDAGAAVSEEEVYFLPGDITTLTNGMTGSALQAVVGTYSALKAAIDAKKVILCNIGGTSGSCPISARIVSGNVLVSTVYVDKAGNKTTSFGINLIVSGSAWATETATGGLYKKDLATTDTIPGSEFYKIPGDISTLSSSSSVADIKGVYGALTTFKAALTAKKAIMGTVNDVVFYINAGLEDSTHIVVSANSGIGILNHRITISASDYVSIEVTENQLVVSGNVVETVTATTNKGIEIGGTATKPTVGLKLDSTGTKGNVDLTVGVNGLKANFTETKEVHLLPGDLEKLVELSDATNYNTILGTPSELIAAIEANKVIASKMNLDGIGDELIVVNSSYSADLHKITFEYYFDVNYVFMQISLDESNSTYQKINPPYGYNKSTILTDSDAILDITQGNGGIEVTGDNTNKKVGLKLDTTTPGNVDLAVGANGLKATLSSKAVKSGDKVLKVETDKSISATVSLGYDSEGKKLQLKGINEEVFNELDVTAFIKDGMLNSAELVVNPSDQPAGTYIKLVFNTEAGKDPIFLNVTSLIDVYTSGNGITVSGKSIAIKLDPSTEKYMTVSGSGLKLSGIDQAISDAITAAFSWHDVE